MTSFANIDPIAIAFAAFNLLRLASYVPQIITVARDQNGATAISFSCWTIWVGANSTASTLGLSSPTPISHSSAHSTRCAAWWCWYLSLYRLPDALRLRLPDRYSGCE